MTDNTDNVPELCVGCVYFPPNLPAHAYQAEDWKMLQEKSCSFEYLPDDEDCRTTRKTSCSIVDMANLTK
ncbi:MAG: hypothetical protein COA54_03600 [Thiotrichaceae bacterium]|nr:MAG: hypothetical protein COA54_03600 [Thiotrichaceae bacterium]